jgi:tRNA (cmo5U34)-methyltransferase
MTFKQHEIDYLRRADLGRLATIGRNGTPQNSPVGFTYNEQLGTIDIAGYQMSRSQKYRNIATNDRVAFVVDDIATANFDGASLVLSYCTMQFVHPSVRQQLFDQVFSALQWGGAFFLFEKVRAPDARFQDLTTQLYHEFKLRNGFDEKEILTKQRSLKGVLEPFSTQGNLDLLARAGFKDVMTLIKYVCFEGFLAIK